MFELRIKLPYLSANTPEELERKIADIKRNVLERAMVPTAYVAFSQPETVQVVGDMATRYEIEEITITPEMAKELLSDSNDERWKKVDSVYVERFKNDILKEEYKFKEGNWTPEDILRNEG